MKNNSLNSICETFFSNLSYDIYYEGPSNIEIDYETFNTFDSKEEEDEFTTNTELSCIFLLRNKKTAENIIEWLSRRFFEEYNECLDISIHQVYFYPKQWGIFIREEYEFDVMDLMDMDLEVVC